MARSRVKTPSQRTGTAQNHKSGFAQQISPLDCGPTLIHLGFFYRQESKSISPDPPCAGHFILFKTSLDNRLTIPPLEYVENIRTNLDGAEEGSILSSLLFSS